MDRMNTSSFSKSRHSKSSGAQRKVAVSQALTRPPNKQKEDD